MKKLIAFFTVVVIFVCFGAFALSQNRKTDTNVSESSHTETDNNDEMKRNDEETLLEIGRNDRKAYDLSSDRSLDSIYMKGENIVIYTNEVETIKNRHQLLGEERDGEELAVDFLLRREAIYLSAVSQGFNVSDDEVKKILELEREHYESRISVNPDDFFTYLEGIGITIDQYFEWQFEIKRQELIRAEYINHEQAAFMKTNGFESWTEDNEESWQNHLQRIIDDVLEKDRVVKVS